MKSKKKFVKKKKRLQKANKDLEKVAEEVKEDYFFRKDCFFKEDEEHRDNLACYGSIINGSIPFFNKKTRIAHSS
jgi:hypothetical protein